MKLTVLLILLLTQNCHSSWTVEVLSIESGMCLGDCPVYSLKLESDGHFVLTQSLLWTISIVFIITSCKKSEFFNLTATISSDNNYFGAEEGQYVTFNINLTDELSEDLTLEMQIVRDLKTGSYINLDDVEDFYEYSSDFGDQWKRVRPNQVIIPKKTKGIKIRMLVLTAPFSLERGFFT